MLELTILLRGDDAKDLAEQLREIAKDIEQSDLNSNAIIVPSDFTAGDQTKH